jgi:hypothetical protein
VLGTPYINKSYASIMYVRCISVRMYVHAYYVAPKRCFFAFPPCFPMEPHWGYCGICDESLRPPFHGLRDPPWPNLRIYELVQRWRPKLVLRVAVHRLPCFVCHGSQGRRILRSAHACIVRGVSYNCKERLITVRGFSSV